MKNNYFKLGLLTYWVLVMNLWSSLHHSEFFGIHGSSCCAVSHHHAGHSHSSCDHHHCHDHSSHNQIAGDSKDGNLLPEHSCSVCEFFKKYHGVPSEIAPVEAVEAVTMSGVQSESAETTRLFVVRVRGPPCADQI